LLPFPGDLIDLLPFLGNILKVTAAFCGIHLLGVIFVPDILAISSSPRRNGNSELALRSFCRAAEEKDIAVELIRLHELRLSPCRGCELCARDGKCVVEDNMQPLYKKVAEARGLVLATPIYFGSLSAQLKIFIDRFECWWHAKYRLKKPFVLPEQKKAGFLLCAGALRKPEFGDNAAFIAGVFFHSINYHYDGMLHLQGLDNMGAINSNPAALKDAYDAGKEFVRSRLLL
jgi:multimeric flavodoxin WrbA